MDCDRRRKERSLFRGDVAKEFAERLAKGEDAAQIVGGKVTAGGLNVCAFTADLNDANHFVAGQNWSADHFLNDFGAFGADLHPFENRGMPDTGEIVDDVRPAFA